MIGEVCPTCKSTFYVPILFVKLCVLGAACASVLLCFGVRVLHIPRYYNVPEVLSCTKSFFDTIVCRVQERTGVLYQYFPIHFLLISFVCQRLLSRSNLGNFVDYLIQCVSNRPLIGIFDVVLPDKVSLGVKYLTVSDHCQAQLSR